MFCDLAAIPEKEHNGSLFLHEGAFVFSPNSKRTDVQVPKYASHDVDPVMRSGGRVRLGDYTTPQYYAGMNYAWMAMIPLDVRWEGFLETFADHNIPLVPAKQETQQYHHLWTAPPTLKDEWSYIEDCFTKILAACAHQTADDATDIHLPCTPSSAGGFTRLHRTRDIATRQLFHSRAWFRILIGAVIFQCSRLDTLLKTSQPSPQPGHHGYFPFWYMLARERFPEIETFCSALRCWLVSNIWRIDFTGMFVRLETTKFIPRGLIWYTQRQVPVWYSWTAREVAYLEANPHLSFYAPPPSLLQNASTLLYTPISNRPPSGTVSSTLGGNRSQNCSVAEFVPASTMSSFFALRDEVDKEGVESRDKAWQHYVWKYRPDRVLVRVRTSAREMYILRHYKHRENHIRHEIDFALDWDLPNMLTDYDTSRTNRPEPGGGISKSDRIDTTQVNDSDGPDIGVPEFEAEFEECLRVQFPPATDEDRVMEHWRWDPSEMARLRFGFVAPTSRSISPPPDTMWHQFKDWLQLTDDKPAGPCPPHLHSITPHLHSFLDAFRPGSSGQLVSPSSFIKPEMWDICCRTGTDLDMAPYLRRLKYIDDDHILVAQCETEPWHLVVLTALDAIHACRLLMQGKSVSDIAFHLLSHAIPFRTMVTYTTPSSSTKQVTPMSEIRTENHRFGINDYHSYLQLRRALFDSEGVARAAFLHGGILWRIALDVLGPPSRELIMGGPIWGKGAEACSTNGWFDNELGESEIYGLCGVYIVPSSEFMSSFFASS